MPPKSPPSEYSVSESTIIRIPVGMAWAMAGGLIAGAFCAAMVWVRVGAFEVAIKRIEKLEERQIQSEKDIISIKGRLGISKQNRDINSVMASPMRDDL